MAGNFIFVLMMLFLFHQYFVVADGRIFSGDDYSQRKAYMKRMNKHAVMSIKTEYGDIYDCVDIYKQPAFDHPLLKNHTLQIEPSVYPNGTRPNNNHYDIQNIGLKGGCPNGTVPIQRIRKSKFLRSDSRLQFGKKWNFISHHYALFETPDNGEYYGTRAFLNVWNTKISDEYHISISEIWLLAGPVHGLNTIQVGWMVYPGLYGDSRTHLFGFWTADAYGRTGCYNTMCPGFVQVNKNIPIDVPLDRVSTYKGEQYEIKIDVIKDPKTGNWFLLKDDLAIGYWPSTIFNHLNIKAEAVHWGGEVIHWSGYQPNQMGSGYFPEAGYGQACYMRELKVIDNKYMNLKEATNGVTNATKPNCYRIIHNQSGMGPLTGSHIIFGGPGGTCL